MATRIQAKAVGASRPKKQNYNKSGKLEARREHRRQSAIGRNRAFAALGAEEQLARNSAKFAAKLAKRERLS